MSETLYQLNFLMNELKGIGIIFNGIAIEEFYPDKKAQPGNVWVLLRGHKELIEIDIRWDELYLVIKGEEENEENVGS